PADAGGADHFLPRARAQHVQLCALWRGAVEPFELGRAAFDVAQARSPYRDGGVAVACDVAVLDPVADVLRDRVHAARSPADTSPSRTGRMCSGRVVRRFLAMSS